MARLLRSRSILAAVVGALVLFAGLGTAIGNTAPRPVLPAVAADELLASSLHAIAARTPVSGTVRTHVDMGLPQLPGVLSDPGGPAQIFLSDQTFKVWRSPDGVRVAQLLPFAERDVVQNATDVWAWDSEKFTAWHIGVPTGAPPPSPAPSVGDLVGLVGNAIDALKPYAAVSLSEPTVVAGRDAYVVSMTPTSETTLVGHIDIAIDAETRLPLRLQIFAKGSDAPSVEGGFTSVDFGPVDPSTFDFTPPDGATVEELTPPNEPPGGCWSGCVAGAGMPEVRVFGEGFGLVIAVPVTDVPKQYAVLLPYSGPLGSVSLIERGGSTWLLAGAVGPQELDAAARRLP